MATPLSPGSEGFNVNLEIDGEEAARRAKADAEALASAVGDLGKEAKAANKSLTAAEEAIEGIEKVTGKASKGVAGLVEALKDVGEYSGKGVLDAKELAEVLEEVAAASKELGVSAGASFESLQKAVTSALTPVSEVAEVVTTSVRQVAAKLKPDLESIATQYNVFRNLIKASEADYEGLNSNLIKVVGTFGRMKATINETFQASGEINTFKNIFDSLQADIIKANDVFNSFGAGAAKSATKYMGQFTEVVMQAEVGLDELLHVMNTTDNKAQAVEDLEDSLTSLSAIIQNIQTNFNAMVSGGNMKELRQQIETVNKSLYDGLMAGSEQLKNKFTGNIVGAVKSIQTIFSETESAVQQLTPVVVAEAKKSAEAVETAAQEVAQEIQQIAESSPPIVNAEESVAAVESIEAAVEELAKPLEEAEKAAEELSTEVEKLVEDYNDLNKAALEAAKAMEEVATKKSSRVTAPTISAADLAAIAEVGNAISPETIRALQSAFKGLNSTLKTTIERLTELVSVEEAASSASEALTEMSKGYAAAIDPSLMEELVTSLRELNAVAKKTKSNGPEEALTGTANAANTANTSINRTTALFNKLVNQLGPVGKMVQNIAAAFGASAASIAAVLGPIAAIIAAATLLVSLTKKLVNGVKEILSNITGVELSFQNLYKIGMEFNAEMERMTNNMAGALVANQDIYASNKGLLGIAEAYNIQLAESNRIINKIQAASFSSNASMADFVQNLQAAMASAGQLTTDMDKIAEFSINITNSAQMLGVAQRDVGRAIKSIIDGQQVEDNILGRLLFGNREVLRLMQKQAYETGNMGNLLDYMNEKMRAFTLAASLADTTWDRVRSNIKDAFRIVAGELTSGAFQNIKVALSNFVRQIITIEDGVVKVNQRWSGVYKLIESTFTMLSKMIVNVLDATMEILDAVNALLGPIELISLRMEVLYQLLKGIVNQATIFHQIVIEIAKQLGVWEDDIEETKKGLEENVQMLKQMNALIRSAVVGFGAMAKAVKEINLKDALLSPFQTMEKLNNAFNTAVVEEYFRQMNDGAKEAVTNLEEVYASVVKFTSITDEAAKAQIELNRMRRELEIARRAAELQAEDAYNKLLLQMGLKTNKEVIDARYRGERELLEKQIALNTSAMNKLEQQTKGKSTVLAGIMGRMTEEVMKGGKAYEEYATNIMNEQKAAQEAVIKMGKEVTQDATDRLTKAQEATKQLQDDTTILARNKRLTADQLAQAKENLRLQTENAKLQGQLDASYSNQAAELDSLATAEQRRLEESRKAVAALREEFHFPPLVESLKVEELRREIGRATGDLKNQLELELSVTLNREGLDRAVALINFELDKIKAEPVDSVAKAMDAAKRSAEILRSGIAFLTLMLMRGQITLAQYTAEVNKLKGKLDDTEKSITDNGRQMKEFAYNLTRGIEDLEKKLGLGAGPSLSTAVWAAQLKIQDMRNEMKLLYKGDIPAWVEEMMDATEALEIQGTKVDWWKNKIKEAMDELNVSTMDVFDVFFHVGGNIGRFFQEQLPSAFTAAIQGTESFSEAITNLRNAFSTFLIELGMRMLVMWGIGKLIEATMPWFVALMDTMALSGQLASLLTASTFAEGGMVRGAGTATSDSIPAMLSNGEYVIKASSVKAWGKGFLDFINNGIRSPITKFADGGMAVADPPATPNVNLQNRIVNVFDPSLVSDMLATRDGEKAVLNIIRRNPRFMREVTV
jgi:chromosome segregation ATPase